MDLGGAPSTKPSLPRSQTPAGQEPATPFPVYASAASATSKASLKVATSQLNTNISKVLTCFAEKHDKLLIKLIEKHLYVDAKGKPRLRAENVMNDFNQESAEKISDALKISQRFKYLKVTLKKKEVLDAWRWLGLSLIALICKLTEAAAESQKGNTGNTGNTCSYIRYVEK